MDLLEMYRAYNKYASSAEVPAIVSDVLTAILGWVTVYCNQPIIEESAIVFIRVNATNGSILLPFTVPVTVVSVHTKSDEFADEVVFDSDNYLTRDDISRLKRFVYRNAMIGSELVLRVNVGYTDEVAIPEKLKLLIVEMATIVIQESPNGQARLGKMSESQTIGSAPLTTTYNDLSLRFAKQLSAYRVPSNVAG